MRVKSVVIVVLLMVLAACADASPIESVESTWDVLLGTASACVVSGCETSARIASSAPGQRVPFQTVPSGVAGVDQSLASLSDVLAPLDLNRAALPVGSVATPLAPACEEPPALVIVLIGLGVVALGSVRLRR